MKNRVEWIKERITEFGARMEITHSKQKRERKKKENEQSWRDLWDYNNRSCICVIVALGERRVG